MTLLTGRTRRVLIACCALTVAAGAVLAGAALRHPAPTLDELSSEPAPSWPTESEKSPVSTPPSPSHTPSAAADSTPLPGATPAPSGSRPTGSAGSGDHGSFGPASPGSVRVRHYSGQHTWSGTSNGFSIRVSMSPTRIRTGQWATFTMRISSDVPYCCNGYMVFGNGLTTGGSSCDRDQSGGGTFTWRTMYNKAKSYPLLMQAMSSACGDDTGVLLGTVDVGAGSTSSNGPERAQVQLSYYENSRPGDLTIVIAGMAEEPDGHIYKLRVDYGDGTSATFGGDQSACQLAPGGWPVNSGAQLPNEPAPRHKYAKPGAYRLVLTAYSRGCDKQDVQTSTSSFTHQAGSEPVPEPSNEPTPSPTPSPTPTSG